MARYTIGKGLDDYLAQLGNLERSAKPVIGMAIYQGAKVVADEIRSEIEALPTEPVGVNPESGKKSRRNLTQVEKDGLLEGLGVTKMKDDSGVWNVKIGMDGYNANVTAKWPYGKPNAMIARSLERGTSFMTRIPFIARAVRKSRKQAETAMQAEVDKEIKKRMK